MGSELIDQIRSFQPGSLNTLEWCGILAIGVAILLVAYKALHLGGRRKIGNRVLPGAKRNLRKEKPRSVPKGRDETVLVVDDDASVLRAHSRLIGRMGYKVQKALGGQEAIDYLRNNHADLIVLDLLMPGLDGIETFRSIKDINPYQRAIVLSGFAGPAMVNSIKTLGVNTYLVKPAEAGILAQAIRDEIDRN